MPWIVSVVSSASRKNIHPDSPWRISKSRWSGNQQAASAALRHGLEAHQNYLSLHRQEPWEDHLNEQLDLIRDLSAGEDTVHASFVGVSLSGTSASGRTSRRPATGTAQAFLAVAGASSMAIVVAGLLMLVAGVAILASSYLTNNTFGTFDDYVALVIATVGSSSVLGVVTLLLLLRSPNDWNV